MYSGTAETQGKPVVYQMEKEEDRIRSNCICWGIEGTIPDRRTSGKYANSLEYFIPDQHLLDGVFQGCLNAQKSQRIWGTIHRAETKSSVGGS